MTTPPAPEPAGQTVHDQQIDARLSGIEQSLADLGARLHPAAQAHTQAHLERPQAIEEQVAAAIRQADESRRRSEADKATKSTLETLTADVAKLKETPPAAQLRAATRVMWGKGRA